MAFEKFQIEVHIRRCHSRIPYQSEQKGRFPLLISILLGWYVTPTSAQPFIALTKPRSSLLVTYMDK